jgi:anti-anti-sigma factor
MELTEQGESDVTVVAVAGRVDSLTAPRLGERLDALLRAGQAHLLIEGSQLLYIGSAGLRALLLAAKRAADQGGCVALCNLTTATHQMVEVAGLDAVLQTYPSREVALAKLTAR